MSEDLIFRAIYENTEADIPDFDKYIIVNDSEESWMQALQIALSYTENTPHLLKELRDMGIAIGKAHD